MQVVNEFLDIFGKTKEEISQEMGHSKGYVADTFRGRNGQKAVKRLAELLTELANNNYETEVAIAAYKRKAAEKIIRKLTE